MGEWRVYLAGHQADLRDLSNLFQTVTLSVMIVDGLNECFFTSSKLSNYQVNEIADVQEIVDKFVVTINAIARLKLSYFESVTVSHLAYVSDVGSKRIFKSVQGVSIARGRILSRANRIGSLVTKNLNSGIDSLINLIDQDVNLAKSLRLLGGLETKWQDLYMVLESIHYSPPNMKNRITTFTRTANSYSSIQSESRHGSVKKPTPNKKMTINEALNMIRDLLIQYIESKGIDLSSITKPDQLDFPDANWLVHITGHEYDLLDLSEIFQSPTLWVRHDNTLNKFCFSSSRLDVYPLEDFKNKNVRQHVEDLINVINAIAILKVADFQRVKFDGLTYLSNNPLNTNFVFPESIESTYRVYAPTIDDGVSQAKENFLKEIERIVNLADYDVDIAKAFLLYGKLNHSWRNLYLVLETVEDAVGGESDLLKQTWLTNISGMKEAIKLFKKTANSYAALGVESRHANNPLPETPMTIDEARTVIRTLLNEWVKTKL